MSKKTRFPPGWDEERVRRVVEHYESQTEEEAVAEDEAALDSSIATVMNVPTELVPEVRELIARRRTDSELRDQALWRESIQVEQVRYADATDVADDASAIDGRTDQQRVIRDRDRPG